MPTATFPPTSSKCAACTNPASLTCSRCRTATYCSLTCQKSDWRTHKQSCITTNLPQTIKRAGKLLQQLILTWCEHAQTKNITSIQDTESRLIIQQGRCRPDEFYRFPAELCKSDEEKEMVLTTAMCSEALAYFGAMLRDMLKGLPISISELTVLLRPVPRSGHILAGPYTSIQSHFPHNVFRITYSCPLSNISGETVAKSWIIDATGAQFNISTVCLEEEEYMSRYVDKITSVNPAGIAKTMYDELCACPGLAGLHHLQRRSSAHSIQTAIFRLKSTCSLTLPSLLRMPKKEYCAATEKLMDMVRKEVTIFTLLWDKKKEVDILLELPTEVHIRHHEEGMRVFEKYGRMGMVE